MYIAKMHTRYPEYHGTGYYNFLMDEDEDYLNEKIERNSHDFTLEGVVKTKHQSIDAIIKAYPTKQQLNQRYFKEA